MGKGNASILVLDPSEYFHGVVAGAVSALRAPVSNHAQAYLVQLLGHFISAENLFPLSADGSPNETLAHQLASALDEATAAERAARLRRLGDFSLYVAGFFTDSLSRKLVDVDYYIGMGEAAYGNVAHLEGKRNRAELFQELSRNFPKLVEVLAQVSEESGFHPENHQDLLRTYDLWVKTGSGRLAKQLTRAGISLTKKPDREDS